MGAQRSWPLSVLSCWIFCLFLLSAFPEMETKISLESTVFVAFARNEIHIKYTLTIPKNHTSDFLTCSNPFQTQIYNHAIPAGQKVVLKGILDLKNLSISGAYSCRYKTATAYWYLRVRDKGYKEPADYTGFIVTAVLTGILLVFSVIGSLFVFRGYWKECISECGNTSRKQEQNTAAKQMIEMGENNVELTAAPSTSLYATLEPRPDPGDIYDVLDRSHVNTDQPKAKSKKRKTQKSMVQSTKPQNEEGVFESVYENF